MKKETSSESTHLAKPSIKTLLFTITILGSLICCTANRNSEHDVIDMAINDLELNEIVHDSLTSKQLKDIERIQKTFAEVNKSTLEETIENFKRDANPNNELPFG